MLNGFGDNECDVANHSVFPGKQKKIMCTNCWLCMTNVLLKNTATLPNITKLDRLIRKMAFLLLVSHICRIFLLNSLQNRIMATVF